MKRFVILTISIFVLFACAQRQVQDPVCPQDGSWICEQSEKLGVQPETVYGWIYSAAAVGAISDVIEIKEICDFEKRIANFYQDAWPVSYMSLVDEVIRTTEFMDPEKALLIKNIINVNLIQYKSPELISVADDAILRKGHVAFRRDMACFE